MLKIKTAHLPVLLKQSCKFKIKQVTLLLRLHAWYSFGVIYRHRIKGERMDGG
jgi:hypothetical protein